MARRWDLDEERHGLTRTNPRGRRPGAHAECHLHRESIGPDHGGRRPGARRGRGQNIKGRKRHIIVDTLGLLLAVCLTSAGLDDGRAASQVLALIAATAFPRLAVIFGDNQYHKHDLYAWRATHRPTWRLALKARPEGSTGFIPVRQRWVVERPNAWNGRGRRNSKASERKPASSAVMIPMSHINLRLNRLYKRPSPPFRSQQKAA